VCAPPDVRGSITLYPAILLAPPLIPRARRLLLLLSERVIPRRSGSIRAREARSRLMPKPSWRDMTVPMPMRTWGSVRARLTRLERGVHQPH
jgi:hypothetical protein